jgi:ubiquinone/menaquinone biosynthesis C-methylase UbiE
MEGMVARWYAANTGRSLADFTQLARRVAPLIPSAASVLEVAPGPGYFCVELARLGPYRIVGLDISHTFVEIGRRNAAAAGVRVDFQQGNAASMPFASEAFDFLVCRAAFKNFAQPVRALEEMRRVLKPGGQGLIIDLRRDASTQDINRYVDAMGLSAANKVLTKLTFHLMLRRSAYTKQHFQEMLAAVGFSRVAIREEDIGLEVLMTK